MRNVRYTAVSLLAAILIAGCGKKEPVGPQTVSVPERAALIVNGLAETISILDIEQGVITNDVVTVGKWPNAIVIRDGRVYVVNSGDNNIQIFDLSNMLNVRFVDIGSNTNPMQMAFLNDRFAYVTTSVISGVSKVDLDLMKVVKVIPLGQSLTGVVAFGGKVYVTDTAFDPTTYAYGQGKVYVIDPAADDVVAEIEVGTNPQFVVVDGDGELNVVCTGDYVATEGQVYVIEPQTDEVVEVIEIGGAPTGITIATDGKAYLASSQGLLSYDTVSNVVLHSGADPLSAFAEAFGVAADPEGYIYVCVPDWTGAGGDRLLVMDPVTEEIVGTYTAGSGAQLVAIR
ncbi:MAG TPA: YncE family protein [Candidatus Latescibacteria bacterium]|nr:YncE family protein [Candidatus Latescibacterota bacterium]